MEHQQQPHRKKEKNPNLVPPLGISFNVGRFQNTLVFLDAKDKHPVEGTEDFLKQCEVENKKSAVFFTVPEQYFVHYLPILKK